MNRDASTTSRPWSSTKRRNEPRACWTGGSAQNRAARVWSAGAGRARARADLLDLVVVASPPLAAEIGRTVRPELVAGLECERPHESEVRPDRRCRGGREPGAGNRRVRRRVGHRGPEAVTSAEIDEGVGDLFADGEAVSRRLIVGEGEQGCVVGRVQDQGRLRRQVVDQDPVGGRGHRRFGRRAGRGGQVDCERLVVLLHRHHRVVHGDRDIGEDRVALCRRQPGGGEGPCSGRVPGGDVGVRARAGAAPATSPLEPEMRVEGTPPSTGTARPPRRLAAAMVAMSGRYLAMGSSNAPAASDARAAYWVWGVRCGGRLNLRIAAATKPEH